MLQETQIQTQYDFSNWQVAEEKSFERTQVEWKKYSTTEFCLLESDVGKVLTQEHIDRIHKKFRDFERRIWLHGSIMISCCTPSRNAITNE